MTYPSDDTEFYKQCSYCPTHGFGAYSANNAAAWERHMEFHRAAGHDLSASVEPAEGDSI